MAKIVVRLDDIHPRMRWDKFERFTSRLERSGITGLLGVIPDCRDPTISHVEPKADFWEELRSMKSRGWLISQHGFTHVYDSRAPNFLGRGNRSEFAGHPFEVQAQRISDGARILRSEGLATDIFMPPGHSFDEVTLDALRANGFNYMSDGYGIWAYSCLGLTFVPHLWARLPRQWMPGVYSTSIHLNSMNDEAVDALADSLAWRASSIVSFYDAAAMRGPVGVNPAVRNLSGMMMRTRWRLAGSGARIT